MQISLFCISKNLYYTIKMSFLGAHLKFLFSLICVHFPKGSMIWVNWLLTLNIFILQMGICYKQTPVRTRAVSLHWIIILLDIIVFIGIPWKLKATEILKGYGYPSINWEHDFFNRETSYSKRKCFFVLHIPEAMVSLFLLFTLLHSYSVFSYAPV